MHLSTTQCHNEHSECHTIQMHTRNLVESATTNCKAINTTSTFHTEKTRSCKQSNRKVNKYIMSPNSTHSSVNLEYI